jgi:CheY-like chemotaxis protein
MAEDNEINAAIAVNLLEGLGHSVTVVEDGTDVLAALLLETFDLLIVDIYMPRLDGYGVAAALRAHPQRAEMPMIALTANTLTADRERCLAAGMDGYVAKPIVRAELVAEIERVLAVQQVSRAA